ncbi:MAG: hypothetical protein RLZZ262_2650 [Bacteroidota bacterium]|jgi:uncharacterized protein (TIGR00661 family)
MAFDTIHRRCKVYLSDEGFGHIVRQRAVVEELMRALPSTRVTVQTKVQAETARRYIANADFIEKFNNILWDKQPSGSPDLVGIADRFSTYLQTSNDYIKSELTDFDYDFVISDFVYEAFEVAAFKKVPAFGVAHFTWDWFFCKLYPPPLHTDVVRHFMKLAEQAKRLYFPPFTPEEILQYHKGRAMEVPLILRKGISPKKFHEDKRFKVLIMDSGAGVLAESIKRALHSVRGLSDFTFYVSQKLYVEQDNVIAIPAEELMVDYVADMDLVIGRAGFNTISECVGLRTPMLLIGEAMNPEMSENILMLKKQNLGSFISMDIFERGLDKYLPAFIAHEYNFIQRQMQEHTIATNGAEVIVNDILNLL